LRVLKKRAHITAKVKSKYKQRTHKFGIRIPKSIKEALRVDAENENSLSWVVIVPEMSNVRVAFENCNGELTEHGKPKGYKFVSTHILVFDVMIGENYRRTARLLADGHKTDATLTITYYSSVRDSVRIALTIAALK
jgi:hypothetical protein